jgi:uncharacterized protein (DUF342 family)
MPVDEQSQARLATKIDLILTEVNKTYVTVERLSGDLRVQAEVLKHVTESFKEHREETKEALAEIKAQLKDHEERLKDYEGFKKWLWGIAAGIGFVVSLISNSIIDLIGLQK